MGEVDLVKEKEKKALVATSRIIFYLEKPICVSKHKYVKVRGSPYYAGRAEQG